MTPDPLSPANTARRTPLHIEAGGYVLRTLEPRDATPAMLDWLQSPAMLAGLNLPPLHMTLDQLRCHDRGNRLPEQPLHRHLRG